MAARWAPRAMKTTSAPVLASAAPNPPPTPPAPTTAIRIRGLRAAERRIRRLFFFTVSIARGGNQAPFSHFFMKLVFAAPESGLPSWLTALVAQVSAMHFLMDAVLAAPA